MSYIGYISARKQVSEMKHIPSVICDIILLYHRENKKEEQKYFHEACESGDLESILYLQDLGAKLTVFAREMIVKSANIEVIKYFLYKTRLSLTCAATYGNLKVYKYMRSFRPFNFGIVSLSAIRNGNLNIVQEIVENENHDKISMLYDAVAYSQLHIINYILSLKGLDIWFLNQIFPDACCRGNLNIVKSFAKVEMYEEAWNNALEKSAARNLKDVILYLFSKHEYKVGVITEAANKYMLYGKKDFLRNFLIRGAIVSKDSLIGAISRNNVEIVEYLLENYSFNLDGLIDLTCNYYDFSEILCLLLKHGARPTSHSIGLATLNNSTECLNILLSLK